MRLPVARDRRARRTSRPRKQVVSTLRGPWWNWNGPAGHRNPPQTAKRAFFPGVATWRGWP
jgi:hypothetical protein